jgi:hypothetical protein
MRGRNHEPYMRSKNSPRPKKARQVKGKFKKSILITFFDIKAIEFILAGRTVNSPYYSDVLQRLRENV